MFNPQQVESEAVIEALLDENKELTRTKAILSASLSAAYQEIQRLNESLSELNTVSGDAEEA